MKTSSTNEAQFEYRVWVFCLSSHFNSVPVYLTPWLTDSSSKRLMQKATVIVMICLFFSDRNVTSYLTTISCLVEHKNRFNRIGTTCTYDTVNSLINCHKSVFNLQWKLTRESLWLESGSCAELYKLQILQRKQTGNESSMSICLSNVHPSIMHIIVELFTNFIADKVTLTVCLPKAFM